MIVPVIVFLFLALLWSIAAIMAICEKGPSNRKLTKWFINAPLHIKEKATGIYRGNFNNSNNYEEFSYVAEIKWRSLSLRDKQNIYNKLTPRKQSYKQCKKNTAHTVVNKCL